MLFSSQLFIFAFLPLSLAVYYIALPSYRYRLYTLLLTSLIFYSWWDIRFLPLLVGSIALNWFLVRIFFAMGAKWVLLLGVVVNLGVLGLFKYVNFLAESILSLTGVAFGPWSIILPLGISFFTFQQISYLLDVRRDEASEYSFVEYAAYVCFFPQLIAGPIVRHGDLIPQFAKNPKRAGVLGVVYRGLVLFSLGLVKKVFFADELGPIANEGFLNTAVLSTAEAWTAAIAFSLQLYFDFSSYSDMAIGLAALFGLTLPNNFDAPYKASNIRVFWRRWHITLSNFLRDYVYIPLGGSRGRTSTTLLVVMVTMLLCGLWHGAGWTFVAWGALHGLAICVNRLWLLTEIKIPFLFGWLMTMLFVCLGWVLFRAENFSIAADMICKMFIFGDGERALFDTKDLTFLTLGAIFAVVGPTNVELVKSRFVGSRLVACATAFALCLVCLRIGQGQGFEFIYFQF